jgi:disulfide bond formation protein DsbB
MPAVLVALLAAAAPLFARASEGLFGLAPCELCLWQRAPYWVTFVLAVLAALDWHRGVLLRLAALAALASAAVAAFHLGVEFRWWPSPLAGCQAPVLGPAASLEDMMRSLAPVPTKPCDEPAYLIPGLPLSMAGMNLIYGLALAGLAWTAARKEPSR